MEPLHHPDDPTKVQALAASIEANGWQGAPLVRLGDQLLTGAHRYAACIQIGMPIYEIPTIAIEDLFSAAGLDFAGLASDYGDPTIDEWGYFLALLEELPASVRDEYGIDLH